MKQMTFAYAEYAGKRKQARKELFLIGVLGIFRPKTTKCSGGHAVRGLQRGITFLALHIASHNKSIT